MERNTGTRVLLHTEQPFLAIGFAAALKNRHELELVDCTNDLRDATTRLLAESPDVALIDAAAGLTLSELLDLHAVSPRTAIVLWGHMDADELVFPSVQLGIRGLIPAGMPVEELIALLQWAGSGTLCFQPGAMGTMRASYAMKNFPGGEPEQTLLHLVN